LCGITLLPKEFDLFATHPDGITLKHILKVSLVVQQSV
jgi:hypothetical protein